MKKISLIALAIITTSLFSCSNEDVSLSEKDSSKNPVGSKSVPGYSLETIDFYGDDTWGHEKFEISR